METLLDFKKICRACLSEAGPLKELFTVCSAEVFKYCTSVDVSDSDSLPQLICQTCTDLLNKLYYFKQVVVRSNMILQQQCNIQDKQDSHPTSPGKNEILEVNMTELKEDMGIKEHLVPPDNIEPPKVKRKQSPSRMVEQPVTKQERMKCMKCGKNFKIYENFEAHMREHFGKKKYCESLGKEIEGRRESEKF